MTRSNINPSIAEAAFSCPHCGAYTSQTWFELYARGVDNTNRVPGIWSREGLARMRADKEFPEETKRDFISFIERQLLGLVFLEKKDSTPYCDLRTHNLHLSKCFSCEKIAVWVHDRLIFPAAMEVEQPNPDMPDDVRADYEEAGRIVELSPRGAAALLRLAIQKLCIVLGERGKNIDDDIASLVKKGLLPVVQKSLDVVRVIGNEAVHPGVIDLNDSRNIACELFALVNIIVSQMISAPKQAEAIFKKLPSNKIKAINDRDGRT